MNISDLLKPAAVIVSLKAQGKKHLLQEIAARAAQVTRLPERKFFETLMERERLGTTGVGQGIAIPHGRLADISEIVGVFARLETPIDYDAVDNQPVDLVFMLLAPEGAGADHLKALARVSRLLRNQTATEKLRAARRPKRSTPFSPTLRAHPAPRQPDRLGVSRHQPAIDRYDRSCQERSCGQAQAQCHVRHFFGISIAAQRRAALGVDDFVFFGGSAP